MPEDFGAQMALGERVPAIAKLAFLLSLNRFFRWYICTMTFNVQYIEPFLIILEMEHHILSPFQALPTSQSLSWRKLKGNFL